MTATASVREHAEASLAQVRNYVEGATRFGITDLRVLDQLTERIAVPVTLRYLLEVRGSEPRDFAGTGAWEESDFTSTDWGEYQAAISEQMDSDLVRAESFNELLHVVDSSPYAAVADGHELWNNPRQLRYSYGCQRCQRHGQHSCEKCCGSGKLTCRGCYGTGSEQQRVVYTGGREEYRWVSCSVCGGCGWYRCKQCGGDGLETCSACEGHGHRTEITTTSTVARLVPTIVLPESSGPEVHSILEKIGFARFADFGEISRQGVVPNPALQDVDSQYQFTLNVSWLSARINGINSRWVLFGDPPQVHDAGQILERLLEGDQRALIDAADSWLLCIGPSIAKRVQPAIAQFCASEIHQEILQAEMDNTHYADIAPRTGHVVGQTYIADCVRALRDVTRRVSTWIACKWALTMALLAPLVLGAGLIWVENRWPREVNGVPDRLYLLSADGQGVLVVALVTGVLALIGWMMSRWHSMRWFNRTGGDRLGRWAKQRESLPGFGFAACCFVVPAALYISMLSKNPIWTDKEGAIYGVWKVIPAPIELAKPSAVSTPRASKQRKSRDNSPPRNEKPAAASADTRSSAPSETCKFLAMARVDATGQTEVSRLQQINQCT